MNNHKQPFHIYGSSVAEWKTSESIHEVIEWFERSHYPYSLFYVPLPNDAEYEIRHYAPQVEGAVFLGHRVQEAQNA
jgi:hypothetical protein